jgi:allantoicase
VSEDPHLPDLAARPFGGMVLDANDEFFAPKENLLKPEQPVFDPNAYTDRGKEMDGWETRRRRSPGCDWCVVRLGIPGVVRSVVVDTTHFKGNYPDRCSLLGTVVDKGENLGEAEWVELLPESKLEGDAVNRFDVTTPLRITHLQLNIYPDGGVARLRVHGEPLSDLRRLVGEDGRAEVAGSKSGAVVLDASDVFFSHPHNLIAPGDSQGMHDGWETRRRRGPGHDWVAVRLAAEAEIDRVEIDTTHFKGNYPDTCSLDGRVSASDDLDRGWSEVIPVTKLGPHDRFVFPIDPPVIATHLRLNIHPDGGLARMRAFGRVTDEGWRAFGVRWLNARTADAFAREVLACCASPLWAAGLRDARPFADFPALLEAADAAWAKLDAEDQREAFRAHPRIGDRGGTSWSRGEQAGVASAADDVRAALEEGNRVYESRFGHVFLVNATGTSAEEMLAELTRRLDNDAEAEHAEAAEQQRQITRIRLDKLVRPPPASGEAGA